MNLPGLLGALQQYKTDKGFGGFHSGTNAYNPLKQTAVAPPSTYKAVQTQTAPKWWQPGGSGSPLNNGGFYTGGQGGGFYPPLNGAGVSAPQTTYASPGGATALTLGQATPLSGYTPPVIPDVIEDPPFPIQPYKPTPPVILDPGPSDGPGFHEYKPTGTPPPPGGLTTLQIPGSQPGLQVQQPGVRAHPYIPAGGQGIPVRRMTPFSNMGLGNFVPPG